jgi:hypothetical protein
MVGTGRANKETHPAAAASASRLLGDDRDPKIILSDHEITSSAAPP